MRPGSRPIRGSAHRPTVLLLTLVAAAAVAAEPLIVVPSINDAYLCNPGKGFVNYDWPDAAYLDSHISLGYHRFSWNDLQPLATSLDSPTWNAPIEAFIRRFNDPTKGLTKKVAFGVMNANPMTGQAYATPKWVFDLGVPAVKIDAQDPVNAQTVPKDWLYPTFLDRMNRLIAKLAATYDGDPRIAFLDIRNYGMWGEGHFASYYTSAGLVDVTADQLRDRYLKPYVDAFAKTRLVIPWGTPNHDPAYLWGKTLGEAAYNVPGNLHPKVGIRRDGILSEFADRGMDLIATYTGLPVVFEYCYQYDAYKPGGAKAAWYNLDALEASIRAGRPTWLEWRKEFLWNSPQRIAALGNLVGYHLVLKRLELPASVPQRVPVTVAMDWLNDGVAPPIDQGCVAALALLDANGKVQDRQWMTPVDPAAWVPGRTTPVTAPVAFTAPPGTYRLALGLFASRNAAAPSIKMGIGGLQPSGWYVLHPTLTVTSSALTVASQPVLTPVVEGSTATLAWTVTGSPEPASRWQSSPDGTAWTDMPGALGPTWTTPPATLALAGTRYRALASNGGSTVTSTPVVLAVVPPTPVDSLVLRFYRECLGRAADAPGLAGWSAALAARTRTGAEVARGFVLGPEFTAQGLGDAAFVDVLYRAFFARSADPAGKSGWLAQLAAGAAREDVLYGFIAAPEFATLCSAAGITALDAPGWRTYQIRQFVRRFYQQLLAREPDAPGLATWASGLADGTRLGADVARGIVQSLEFRNRKLTDEAFIAVLYRGFFDRAGDPSGVAVWLGALKAGQTRTAVVEGFIRSGEFAALCARFGIIPVAAGG